MSSTTFSGSQSLVLPVQRLWKGPQKARTANLVKLCCAKWMNKNSSRSFLYFVKCDVFSCFGLVLIWFFGWLLFNDCILISLESCVWETGLDSQLKGSTVSTVFSSSIRKSLGYFLLKPSRIKHLNAFMAATISTVPSLHGLAFIWLWALSSRFFLWGL